MAALQREGLAEVGEKVLPVWMHALNRLDEQLKLLEAFLSSQSCPHGEEPLAEQRLRKLTQQHAHCLWDRCGSDELSQCYLQRPLTTTLAWNLFVSDCDCATVCDDAGPFIFCMHRWCVEVLGRTFMVASGADCAMSPITKATITQEAQTTSV